MTNNKKIAKKYIWQPGDIIVKKPKKKKGNK